MNNKGQSLVFFVILLPFIFLIFMAIFDIGNLLMIQNKYESDIKSAITYGLKHIDENGTFDKVRELLDYGIPGDKNITVLDKKISVELSRDFKIIGINNKREFNYIGYIEKDKIIINRK